MKTPNKNSFNFLSDKKKNTDFAFSDKKYIFKMQRKFEH